MAFSLRKMLSNITYFKKPGEDDCPNYEGNNDLDSRQVIQTVGDSTDMLNFECLEADSTSKSITTNQKSIVKPSFSETDINKLKRSEKRKQRKLKVDIKKANRSLDEDLNKSDSNVENTPKHVHLDYNSSEAFSERMRKFDFSQSFDIFETMSDYSEEKDLESLSDSETDISTGTNEDDDKTNIKMCRKVSSADLDNNELQVIMSASPESFGDVEIDKNEEDRLTLLLNYQMKLEKLECFLKKLLTEFQFHIEVSKVFQCRSFITPLPGTDMTNLPRSIGNVVYKNNVTRGVSPIGSWNVIIEKEDNSTKVKVRNQLLSMKGSIEGFVNTYLKTDQQRALRRSITFDVYREKKVHKKVRENLKKKLRHYDFPDIRDAMLKLFDPDDNANQTFNTTAPACNCVCQCRDTPTETDSGLTSKTDRSMSITSSLGNFTMDSSTLTAYSESLDQVISYNSFQDTSLYSTLLQKAAIERITFYVQVHSIQLKCETAEQDFESKNVISFHCPSCKVTESEESGLLNHILSPYHCEKIHFLYKTAYIKKCVSSGKQIQPSTVLNPMVMYRDDNKIVCFGDAMYACSLCFENLIVGESVLMNHCVEAEHVERRDKLSEILF